jgi:hypothetical protein
MQSESTRVTTAREAAFRQRYAHSRGRVASLIALDPASEAVVRRAVAALPERRRAVALPPTATGDDWIADLQARAQALLDDAARADLVVMLASAGADCQAGALFGEACRLRGVPVTAIILAGEGASDAALARTLAPLRPIATMVVVASGPDYVEDMLLALRA